MTPVQQIQQILGVTPDGVWGPKSRAALDALVLAHPVGGNDRSEKNVQTLLAPVQPLARQLITDAAAEGITIVVTSGTRTYEEQDALYAKGGVTKARGGYSNHNFGLAFDVTIFKNGSPVWESPDYERVGVLGKALGLSWGGDWVSFKDEPHFELRPDWATHMTEGTMLSELRRRHTVGKDAFV